MKRTLRHSVLLDTVQRVYDLGGSEETWLLGVLEAAAPWLDRGLGTMAWFYGPDTGLLPRALVSRDCAPDMLGTPERILADATPDERLTMMMSPTLLSTGSEGMARVGIDYETHSAFQVHGAEHGAGDFLGARAMDPSGHAVLLGAPMVARGGTTAVERDAWERVAAHLVTALRLRLALARGEHRSLDSAEAVVSPGGRVDHATGVASEGPALHALRQAAIAVDAARSRAGREDPEGALDAWSALVEGRWSLVDHFDSDGRRFLVARRNDPALFPRTQLSPRELLVASYIALGHSEKLVSYELGIGASTVSRCLATVLGKLGLDAPEQLAAVLGARRPGE